MADNQELQKQIAELKERVSTLEGLLVIGADLISEPVRPVGIEKEYAEFLMYNFLAHELQIKREKGNKVLIDPELYPKMASYLKQISDEVNRGRDRS